MKVMLALKPHTFTLTIGLLHLRWLEVARLYIEFMMAKPQHYLALLVLSSV